MELAELSPGGTNGLGARDGRRVVRALAFSLSILASLGWVSSARAGWLPPVNVSEPSASVGGAHVVLDATGDATAVWEYWNGMNTVVAAAYRPAGSPWQRPTDLSEGEPTVASANTMRIPPT